MKKLLLILAFIKAWNAQAKAQIDSSEDSSSYSELTLDPVLLNEMYTVGAIQFGDSSVYIESTIVYKELLSFEFISEQAYTNAFAAKTKMYFPAPHLGRNMEGSVQLFCKNKIVQLLGEPSEDETHVEYEYLGFIPTLNALVVLASGYEYMEYKLFDVQTGEEIVALENFPQVSPNQPLVVSLFSSPYNGDASLSIFQIRDLTQPIWLEFPNWMSTWDRDSMFWGNDGQFYFPVIRASDRWNESGNLRPFTQYARFRLKTENEKQIEKLIQNFYEWHFSSKQFGDYMPSQESIVDGKYMSLDWENQRMADEELFATGFFTPAFLTEYHDRALKINGELQSGKIEYFEYSLPPYYEGYDPWCNCQDYPWGYLDEMVFRIVPSSLNEYEASEEWTWDEITWYAIQVQRLGNEWRINKMSGF